MTAVAVMEHSRYPLRTGADRWSRLVARWRDDRGVGLVELLIALLVLNIGIFATLGAFTSGALALRRASHVSTASAIADRTMEAYRDTSYASIPPACPPTSSTTTTTATGADSRQYTVTVTAMCGSQLTSGSYQGSAAVKSLKVTVSDPGDGNKVLVTSTSTFARCTQAALNSSDTTPCKS